MLKLNESDVGCHHSKRKEGIAYQFQIVCLRKSYVHEFLIINAMISLAFFMHVLLYVFCQTLGQVRLRAAVEPVIQAVSLTKLKDWPECVWGFNLMEMIISGPSVQAPKKLLIAQGELVTLGKTANTILNPQATGREWGSLPTCSPNPRTNKHIRAIIRWETSKTTNLAWIFSIECRSGTGGFSVIWQCYDSLACQKSAVRALYIIQLYNVQIVLLFDQAKNAGMKSVLLCVCQKCF